MQIPNIFKARTGAIQLADLDANFDILQVTVNQQAELYSALDSRVTSLSQQIANFSAIPIGCIVMWSGTISTIPDHWRLCDGSNNTPDLRDKFVIGARSDSVGKANTLVTGDLTFSGGTKDSTVVSHTHTASSTAASTVSVSTEVDSWAGQIRASDSGLYAVSGSFSNAGGNGATFNDTFNTDTNNENRNVNISHTYSHDHDIVIATTVNTTINSEGVTGTNSNLPPYYALAYIMRV